jgi:hypothetical protein
MTLLVFAYNDLFQQTELKTIYRYLSDGFIVPGILICGLGLLTVASDGGTFDMLGYSVSLFFLMFKRDISKEKREVKDFYEYRKLRHEKKHSFLYLIIIGAFYIVLSLIFFLLYNKA